MADCRDLASPTFEQRSGGHPCLPYLVASCRQTTKLNPRHDLEPPGWNPLHRPAGVFGNQWLGIFGDLLQVGQGGGVAGVAQRHADVPQQAEPFHPQYRTGKGLIGS
jgi:hypothetical protein